MCGRGARGRPRTRACGKGVRRQRGEGTRGGWTAGWLAGVRPARSSGASHAAAAAPAAAAASSPPFTHRARPPAAASGQGLTIGREHGGNQVRLGEGLDDGGVGGLHSTARSRAKCRKVRKASASSRMRPEEKGGGRGGGGGSLGRRRRCPEDAGRAGPAVFPEGLPGRRAAQGRCSQPHGFADDVQVPALPHSPAPPPAGCRSPCSCWRSLRQGEGDPCRVKWHGGRAGAAGGAARGQRRQPQKKGQPFVGPSVPGVCRGERPAAHSLENFRS